jgi:hypothetical protein
MIFTFFCFFLKPMWTLFTSAYFSSTSASSRKTKRCVYVSLVVVYIAMNGSWSVNLRYHDAAPSLACVLITRFTKIHTWHLHTGTSNLFRQRAKPLLWAVWRTAHVQITISGKRNGQNCYVISIVYIKFFFCIYWISNHSTNYSIS